MMKMVFYRVLERPFGPLVKIDQRAKRRKEKKRGERDNLINTVWTALLGNNFCKYRGYRTCREKHVINHSKVLQIVCSNPRQLLSFGEESCKKCVRGCPFTTSYGLGAASGLNITHSRSTHHRPLTPSKEATSLNRPS